MSTFNISYAMLSAPGALLFLRRSIALAIYRIDRTPSGFRGKDDVALLRISVKYSVNRSV